MTGPIRRSNHEGPMAVWLIHIGLRTWAYLTTCPGQRRVFGDDSHTRNAEPGCSKSIQDVGFPESTAKDRRCTCAAVQSEHQSEGCVSRFGRPVVGVMESEVSREECSCC